MKSAADQNMTLCLKNIHELLGERFYIPSFQRGYRWGGSQVIELLDDIWEFNQSISKDDDNDFYCLQPVVVTTEGDGWQVVDGQQRLTTLWLILHFLEKKHLMRTLAEAYKKPLYSIKYETRSESESFLQSIHIDNDSNLDNIDFFHFKKAYQAIEAWFESKDYNDNNKLLTLLLAKPNEGRAVKVIWYDLSGECQNNDYAVEVFSRINIGKIPLTNAELIKALFLKNSNFEGSDVRLAQLQISADWDFIEKRLRDPTFWYFIANTNKDYPTRIEYIFDLMKNKRLGEDSAFYTFHKFNEDFKSTKNNIETLWQEIKRYFLTFDEWFQNRELYHLIGFLVDCGVTISSLKNASEKSSTKKKFIEYLKKEIKNKVEYDLTELSYQNTDGRQKLRRILLLHNIQTLLTTQDADIRFPFNRYKLEKWDIEHIRAKEDTLPNNSTVRKEWLTDIQTYFKRVNNEFYTKANTILEQGDTGSEFDVFFNDVSQYFKSKQEQGNSNSLNEQNMDWKDQIGNLALLDASTNRSYKNAPFPIKRAIIIKNDKQGIFIPICTKNAFLKYYSNGTDNLLVWSESDAKSYQKEIENMLKEYLPKIGESYE